MTQTLRSNGGQLSRMRRYRRLAIGAVLAGVAGNLALRTLDFPVAAEVVYIGGFLAFLAIWLGTDVTLFDEREQAIEQRASAATLSITAVIVVFGAATARLFPPLLGTTVPTAVHYALYAFIVQFVLFAGVYGWLRYRP